MNGKLVCPRHGLPPNQTGRRALVPRGLADLAAGNAAMKPELLSTANPLCPFNGKTGWTTKDGAKQALRSQRRQGLEVWRAYRCPCGLWHLTHRRRR